MSRRPKKGELLTAFKRGDIENVLRLSADIPDFAKANIPNIISQYKAFQGKSTPLTVAIQLGNYHLCRLLVEDGHSLNGELEKHYRIRPLSLALHFKHSDIAELLVELGADVNLINNDRNTFPLFWAVHEKQSTRIIDVIISAGFPVNALVMRNEKMTAIQCAALVNNIEAVKTLIKYPVDLNALNTSGETALAIAVRRNCPEIVKLIVEKGGNLHYRNTSMCPLFIAFRFDHLKMAELLLDLGADLHEGWVSHEVVPPLQYAVSYLNVGMVMLLLARGANVHARHPITRETALHVAATYVGTKFQGETMKALQLKIAKALIAKGAEVDVKDIEGRSPLDGAVCTENTELCKLLIKEGAEVIAKGVNGSGLLSSAPNNRFEYICCVRAFTCPELVRLCLERGGDYNYRDRHGLTPYHCVMAKHNPDMIRAFWQHGCPYDQPELVPGKMKEMLWYKPDSKDKALLALQAEFMDGIKNNRLDSVVNAIAKGAEPKGCSMKIPSTLHFLAASGNHNIARVLLENGVAINKINEKGQSPLYIAVQKNNLHSCKVFLQYGACYNYYSKKLPKDKTIKCLVRENYHKNQVSTVFKKIYKCFKLAKCGNCKLLKILHKLKSREDKEMIKVLMNCVNHKGFTLLATVLSLGHISLAEELMEFRLRNL